MSNGCSAPRARAPQPFVTTEIDPETGALFARNPWNAAFGARVAFADLGGRQTELDRRPRASSSAATARWPTRPALAGATPLSERVGAGLDPCGALRTTIDAAARR